MNNYSHHNQRERRQGLNDAREGDVWKAQQGACGAGSQQRESKGADVTRHLTLTRTEGEALIDLLEESADRDNAGPEDWRYTLAADVRELFGCRTREEESRYVEEQAEISKNTTIKHS